MWTPKALYQWIISRIVRVFHARNIYNDNEEQILITNHWDCLRIFLSMMVTNCIGERTSSKLKLIKSELRCCITQKRLNSLSVMSIHSDVLLYFGMRQPFQRFHSKKIRQCCIAYSLAKIKRLISIHDLNVYEYIESHEVQSIQEVQALSSYLVWLLSFLIISGYCVIFWGYLNCYIF